MQITDASVLYPLTSPENFASLTSWHEADALNGIVPHKGIIGTARDLSKNNFDLTGGTVVLLNGACNGHSVFRFDGASVITNVAFADFGDTFTTMIVCSYDIGGTVSQTAASIETAASVAQIRPSLLSAGGFFQGQAIDSAGLKTGGTGVVDGRDGKFHIHTVTCDGATLKLFVDSIQIGAGVAYVPPNPNVTTKLFLGVSTGGANLLGAIAAIVTYNGVAMTDVNRLALENGYFRRKFFGTQS